MINTAGIPGDRICSFIERAEHIDDEIKALNEGKKEVFAEAKGEGFDVKVLKEILRLRKQDKDERDEYHHHQKQDSLLDLYLRAHGKRRLVGKRKRRRAKSATNSWWLNEFCSHRPSINLQWNRRSRGRAESKPLVKLRPASPPRNVANRDCDRLLLADENH